MQNENSEWVLCPICHNKTRTKLREDTELKNFPLFCPKCKNEIHDFYIAGADAVACVKSTCYNLCKANYGVNVLSDCITSYDKKKIEEMLRYYESKGCKIIRLSDLETDTPLL